ncbi:MAG: hypothetical protein ABI840_05890 [bacterium]
MGPLKLNKFLESFEKLAIEEKNTQWKLSINKCPRKTGRKL